MRVPYVTAPSFRLHKKHQLKMASSRASTSFTTASGMRSSRLPFRAPISMVLGWSQRITPVVFVPASSSETVKPAARAKFPPLVTGTTTGSRVSLLNDACDTMSTGRFPLCSWPAIGSSETSQISPLSIYRSSLPTAGASIHSRSSSLISACGSHCASSSSSE